MDRLSEAARFVHGNTVLARVFFSCEIYIRLRVSECEPYF